MFIKIVRGLPLMLAGAAAATTVALSVPASASHQHGGPTLAQRTVAAFNDGFATAKADDCQQGFGPACAWAHGPQVVTMAYTAAQAGSLWHRTLPRWLRWRWVGTVDGHRKCIMIVGRDTAALMCRDGYTTTS